MTNQAAQTMHPDALPDGTLSKSTAKRVEALAAASVSERARELLALSCDKYGWWKLAQILRGTAEGRLHEREVIALDAIEHALSSPRQEGEGKRTADGWRTEPGEEDWRIGWALAYCGWALYTDDGELQDNRELPQIDFARDSAADIRRKIRERAEKHGRIIESAGSYGPFSQDEGSTAASTQGDGDGWEENFRYLLDRSKYTLRSREGAGAEDLMQSAILTFTRMESLLTSPTTGADGGDRG